MANHVECELIVTGIATFTKVMSIQLYVFSIQQVDVCPRACCTFDYGRLVLIWQFSKFSQIFFNCELKVVSE